MTSTHPKIRLDHIGIAVQDPKALKVLFTLLGVDYSKSERVTEQGVNVHFHSMPQTLDSVHLELLEVEDPNGTVAKFIEKRGTGVHHLSFELAQGTLDATCTLLQSKGYKLIYSAPKLGAQNMRINFIHPASACGVLIELMERNG